MIPSVPFLVTLVPKFRQHLCINFAVLSIVEVATQLYEQKDNPAAQIDLGRFGVNVGGGLFAGALPDLLEPSLSNPNHRGFCHSLAAAVLMWWLMSGRHTYDLPVALRRFLLIFAAGYVTHLGADLVFSKAKGMGLFGRDF